LILLLNNPQYYYKCKSLNRKAEQQQKEAFADELSIGSSSSSSGSELVQVKPT